MRINVRKSTTKLLKFFLQLSILFFDHGLIPFLKYITQAVFGIFIPDSSYHIQLWFWIETLLSYTFKMLWVIPLFWLSKPLNSFWFQEIAIHSYQSNRGRPKPTLTTKSSSLVEAGSRIIADFFFSLLVEFFFLLQGSIFDFIPVIGRAICILQMAILYSLYAYEYKWINMGFLVQERLYRIEYNLPFYCGFGLPLAILTYIPESFFIRVLTCHVFSPVIWLTNAILTRSQAPEKSDKADS
ncbi:uncharacterized protein TRIADDRAFT_58294 [Trichoplax adhaerens]|uniref:Etoposide-induced protein 2.4 homolog n=1 Tax=Trichoplax adhaerens TaxID=10228 RepID=B3S1H6_TRIAD|nr:hypothetical protein TRIADDRAFT_58294 [Trichoplax adhaerens]EDV23544.1 hypothetical protein TRIADDRAFT_58294 [Trichoplax adhaerens]|eukprot:XP_002114454.1 hypothetical protein TRIADDRAFT_58294 [Trichoplax adhaerens]